MKKLWILLLVLVLSSCQTSVEPQPSSDYYSMEIVGKYICSSDYFSNDYFIEYPECIPYIVFYDNGACEVLINYLEGIVTFSGDYHIQDTIVKVQFEFKGSIFEGDNDEYCFSILDENCIRIEQDCYTVQAGDLFKRMQ